MNFLEEFEMSEKMVSNFAIAMRQVATADGDIDPNEEALISQFSKDIHLDTDIDFSAFSSEDEINAFMFVNSLVAIADGKILDAELEVLNEFAEKLQCPLAISAYLQQAAQALLSQYPGLTIELCAPKFSEELGIDINQLA